MIAFGIGMIYDPPVAVHIIDQCAVSFRPPVVMGSQPIAENEQVKELLALLKDNIPPVRAAVFGMY